MENTFPHTATRTTEVQNPATKLTLPVEAKTTHLEIIDVFGGLMV